MRSESWHTSAHTLRREGFASARRRSVRTHSQEDAETPTPGVRVWRTPSSRAWSTPASAGAARTAATQRCAPAA